MAIKVLLLTHKGIGKALIHATEAMLGKLPLLTTTITVSYKINYDKSLAKLQRWINEIEQEHELLILTDLYGSTPSNLAKHLNHMRDRVRIISGLNLPMLIRVMNYAQLPLTQLSQKALAGGRDGIVPCLSGHDYD